MQQDGYDFVKVYSLLPRDAYFGIASEANGLGIPFAGHVPYSVGIAEASDAKQKSMEHLTGVLLGCSSREAIRECLEPSASPEKPPCVLERGWSEWPLMSVTLTRWRCTSRL